MAMSKRRCCHRRNSMWTIFSFIILVYTLQTHAWCPLNVPKPSKSRAILTLSSTLSLGARRRQSSAYEEEEDYYYDDDSYWQEEEQQTSKPPPPFELKVDMDALLEEEQQEDVGSGVYYNVYFEGNYQEEELQVDWEECEDGTSVLLPPPYVSSPRCVIHFVGGTFFGSSPKLWYKTLLEGIVRATQSVVVATPIPVTLLQNPLQHVRISRKLQRQFQTAYTDVVQDEYGQEELQDVPVVAMGHSLGARLLTVLATLDQPSNKYNVPPYQSYILMSFTNYGSVASIPGIQSLLNQSKRLEENGGRANDESNNNDDYCDSREPRQRRRRRIKEYMDDDDEYDEEWEELMQDFTSTWREQATRVKTALTPASKELEFYPSPNQLWKALQDDGRYSVPNTLIVQFEQDTIDQSPRLTDCLLESYNTDIKYCRLKGVHLTPVSASSSDDEEKGAGLLELSKRTTKALWKLVRGKQSPHTSDELRELRQSIARYITDVVAAPKTTSTSPVEQKVENETSTTATVDTN